jgi:hypothetical protein
LEITKPDQIKTSEEEEQDERVRCDRLLDLASGEARREARWPRMSSRGGSRRGAPSGVNAGTRVAYVGVGSDKGRVGPGRASGAAVDRASRAGVFTTGSGERRGGDSSRSGNAGTGMA